jgi:hypothetical protein
VDESRQLEKSKSYSCSQRKQKLSVKNTIPKTSGKAFLKWRRRELNRVREAADNRVYRQVMI